jgi:hypothetical protein
MTPFPCLGALALGWAVDSPLTWATTLGVLGVTTGLGALLGHRRARTRQGPRPDPSPAAPERRGDARRPVTPRFVLLIGGGLPPGGLEGLVLDRSAGGLGLSLKAPVAAGAVLEARPTACPAGVAGVRVEVRYCRPVAGRWKAGCRFAEPPAPALLRLLG